MAYLTPDDQFDAVKRETSAALEQFFPVIGNRSELRLNGVEIQDELDAQDIRAQKRAIHAGSTWAVPVKADLSLVRNGKEVDRKKITVMHLPKTTDRFSYIVDGTEYQSLTQFRQKSGVYHRRAANDKLYAEYNLANRDQFANGRSFKVRLDPEDAVFYLEHGNSSIPLYHLLKGAGVTDEQLRKSWGQKILEANQDRRKASTVYKAFYKAINRKAVPRGEDPEEHAGLFGELLGKTKLLPETTKRTLGREYDGVTPEVVLRSTGRLLSMSRGESDGDDRTALEFQSVHTIDDFLRGRLLAADRRLRRKVLNNVDKARSVRRALPTDAFDRAVRGYFSSDLTVQPDQTNPVEMLAGQLRTTIMGEQGGHKSAHSVRTEQKLIHPSHLGFLDPIHTPEGDKTGVTLTLPVGVRKQGNELTSQFTDARTGKRVRKTPAEMADATVAFPDQYDWGRGRPKARGRKVQAIRDGEMVKVSPSEVDYIVPSPRALYGVVSNLIPFLQNNQGNRASMAVRQAEQAVPLVHREAPLVQTQTDREGSFEDIVGTYASRYSPVTGEVVMVKKDSVVVADKEGKRHEVHLYKDFPLKGNSLYDMTATVQAGDKVKEGDLVADSTFTRGGVLALGTNLRAAYMPFKGYNFEDGIVISEAAAQKLKSAHLHAKDVRVGMETIADRKKFLAAYPYDFKKDQVEGIGDDGVVRVGQKVREGDPLVLMLRKPSQTQQLRQVRKFRRGRPDKYRNNSLVWDKPYEGVVTDVVRGDKAIQVFVRTEEPAQVGDKLVGRHANKGVITRIIPEAEMPYTEEGDAKRHFDILLNPLGVPGRINLGQILEAAAGKIAEKDGKPYMVRNFQTGVDYLDMVRSDLKKAGLVDKEPVINPDTGRPFTQKVLVGNSYIYKLQHQAVKKMSARSGGPGMPYDVNQAPGSGAPKGGQSMGELGLYSMLAHGARENIHEMFAHKSSQNDALWDALREGTPIPPPQTPFAYEKFLAMLNSMRVNVKKEGDTLTLVPYTEKQIKDISNGRLKAPAQVVRGKDLRPATGGLFDERITGGMTGTKWAHVELTEPIPNPLFEDAIKKLTGTTAKEYAALVRGETEVNGKRGGAAVEELLRQVDVKTELADARRNIKRVRGERRSNLHKRLRILQALDKQGLDPTVYMMRSVPVIPPVFRPVSVRDDGSLSTNDLNYLYKDIGATNEVLEINKKAGLPPKHMTEVREELYDGVKALMGVGTKGSLTRGGEARGILRLIHGETPKDGYFQRKLMKRRQDFSGRSIITPEPRMGLDEVGLPEEIAWTMYQPFIEKELAGAGWQMLDAIDEVKNRTPAARRAMDRAIQGRPVLMKRDPSLHKFNVMAFKPRLVRGKALEIHPLVTGGFNADFDGDTMSVYLPITSGAVKEATKLFPSNNLFDPSTGRVMYTPGHEALLGVYLASQPGKRTNKRFTSLEAARSAHRRGRIELTDVIHIGKLETTLGRAEIDLALPQDLRELGRKPLSEMRTMDGRGTSAVLTQVAQKHPDKFAEVVNRLKDIGNDHSHELGYSIGLDDFDVINRAERDKIVAEAERRADQVRGDKRLTKAKRDAKVVNILQEADAKIEEINEKHLRENPTNIYRMVISGSRGKPSQLKQIISSPALVMDAQDKIVPHFIPRSYSEGLDVGSYWTSLSGARKGTIDKVQKVRDPGYLSKQVVNTTINQVVAEADCGATEGVALSTTEPDVVDRYLARPIRCGRHIVPAGTLVTPQVLSECRRSKVAALPVRSPLRCKSTHGVCQKCMGADTGGRPLSVGTNVGVIAAQAIGEPSTQLSMNTFHTGGIAKGKAAERVGTFERLQQLLLMPKTLPNAATLAHETGVVKQVLRPPQGGEEVVIGDTRHYIPATQQRTVRRGQTVRKGDSLSTGSKDPRALLSLRGMNAVQDYLADEIHGVMNQSKPIKRRNMEVVVRAMTGVTHIEDEGDHPDWVVGDVRPYHEVEAYNRRAKKPVKHVPFLKGVDVLPLEMQEDWVAKLNFNRLSETLIEAAREGHTSRLHGLHPVPSLAGATEFGKAKAPFWGQY